MIFYAKIIIKIIEQQRRAARTRHTHMHTLRTFGWWGSAWNAKASLELSETGSQASRRRLDANGAAARPRFLCALAISAMCAARRSGATRLRSVSRQLGDAPPPAQCNGRRAPKVLK
jgi:hypothetical protein